MGGACHDRWLGLWSAMMHLVLRSPEMLCSAWRYSEIQVQVLRTSGQHERHARESICDPTDRRDDLTLTAASHWVMRSQNYSVG